MSWLTLLLLSPLAEAGLFQQPSVSLCDGQDCSSNCARSSSADSCSLLGFGIYAAATCGDFGSLSLKLCKDSGCNSCETVSSGGCSSLSVFGQTLSVSVSCSITSLAIAAIVVGVILFFLCFCYCEMRGLCPCCCTSTDANAAVTRRTVVTRSEESTPLVSRRELELREKIFAAQRKLVEARRRVEAVEARPARDALFERGRAARLLEEDPDIPNVPLSAAELSGAGETRFQASADIEYWPQPEPSGPLTMGSFKRPFDPGADK